MFGNDIFKKLQHFKNFIGVYSRDTLPNNITLPMALIVNTDIASQPGTHWVAIYIDSNGIGEYFDSFGLPPLYTEIIHFIHHNSPNGYFWNRITLQCLTCVTCGEYSIAYIITRLKGATYADYISLFTSNLYKNDELIKLYYNALN